MPESGFGGQSSRHNEFREWARLALGDPRQVYAKRAGAPPGTPLVLMPDGAADEYREAAKSGALICPVSKCPSPQLHTRACVDRRDHFVHDVAPGGEEGKKHKRKYLRLATKHLLCDWAEGQKQVVEVRELASEGEEGLEGIAFVLAANLDDGSKVALCYVDKRLGADVWEEHLDAQRSRGLASVWIFALTKTYFELPHPADPIAENPTDLIVDKAIYRRMRKRGSWPLLLHPEAEEWANLLKPGGERAKKRGLAHPGLDRVLHLDRSRLARSRLCPWGIATPAVSERVLRVSSNN